MHNLDAILKDMMYHHRDNWDRPISDRIHVWITSLERIRDRLRNLGIDAGSESSDVEAHSSG